MPWAVGGDFSDRIKPLSRTPLDLYPITAYYLRVKKNNERCLREPGAGCTQVLVLSMSILARHDTAFYGITAVRGRARRVRDTYHAQCAAYFWSQSNVFFLIIKKHHDWLNFEVSYESRSRGWWGCAFIFVRLHFIFAVVCCSFSFLYVWAWVCLL